MNNDYNDFIQPDHKTPAHIDKRVRDLIYNDLNISHQSIFLKLVLIHGFIGILTMTFCPQFNLSLTNSYELFHFFHKTFGHEVCMMICGTIFLGSGGLFALMILNESEIYKIKKSKFLYYTAMSIISVSVLSFLGSKIYLNLIFFWIIGATFGAVALFEISKIIREKIYA